MTGFTMFSGGGGVELGLSHIVHFVGGVEYDPAIAAHHTAALGTPVTVGDVREVDCRQWSGVDYLHSSPPCPRFSLANSKGGETALDIALASSVCRAIDQTKCRIFTLENVPAYKDSKSLKIILSSLKGWGFRVAWGIYDAADFGVPQHRQRLLLRAWQDSAPLPDVRLTHADPKIALASALQPKLWEEDALLPWNGWHGAVSDLLDSCPECDLAPWQVKRLTAEHGENWMEKLVGSGASLVLGAHSQQNGKHDTPANLPSFTCTCADCGSFRAVLVGSGGYAGEVEQIGGESPAGTIATVHSGVHRALLIEGQSKGNRPPSVTEQGKDSPAQCGTGGGNLNRALLPAEGLSYRVVSLTTRCIARLMSVEDGYTLPASKTLATKILGNMVPPGMARGAFAEMLEVKQ